MYEQELSEINHMSQPAPIEDNDLEEENWHQYLNAYPSCPRTYPYRLELTNYFRELQLQGRYLFHMTITYKPYKDRNYSEKSVNTFFINFYVKRLLRYLLKTRNIHTNIKREVQPICYAFLHESEGRPRIAAIRTSSKQSPISVKEFPITLHHHAILAVHPDNVDLLRHLVGTNTLNRFGNIIMSTDLKECDAGRLLYASNTYWKYPDFLTFPKESRSVRSTK
jgi:hypothetical protein